MLYLWTQNYPQIKSFNNEFFGMASMGSILFIKIAIGDENIHYINLQSRFSNNYSQ